MDTAVSLSEQWRINKSEIKELEYVEILRSLRRLVAYHTKPYDIKYVTKAGARPFYAEHNVHKNIKPIIYINPKVVKDSHEFPLPGDKFDVLCGLTLHGLAHILIGSFDVSYKCWDDMSRLVMEVGEEICADNYFAKNSKQWEYIRTARDFYGEVEMRCNTGNPLLDALTAYTSMIIYNKPVTDISEKGKELLPIIEREFHDLTKRSPDNRARVYKEVARQIQERLGLETQQSIDNYMGKGSREQAEKASDNMLKEWAGDETSLTQKEAVEIEKLLAEEATDVSQLVSYLTSDLTDRSERYSRPNAVITKNAMTVSQQYWEPDEKLVKALLWLRNIKTSRDTVILRAQETGKIDKRRLYRAPIDGLVFRDTRTKKKMKKNIWLLMDNSSSMRSNAEMFKLCAAVKGVLPEARIYSYHATYGRTEIIRLDSRRRMLSIKAVGDTPSGDAILFVGHLLQQARGGLLIHFSDGAVNSGISIKGAYRVIEKKLPNVVLINSANDLWYLDSPHLRRIHNIHIKDEADFAKLLQESVAIVWGLL
ncbi:MAG TPA: VWA domain-containing protein [Dehalococcoidia bacterium]|nr:VWA domain-containing protein [Dehalococcoidia bacterium]